MDPSRQTAARTCPRPRRRATRRTAVAATVLLAALAPSRLGSPAPRPVRAQDFPPALPASGRIVYTRQALDTFDMFTSDPDGANESRLSTVNESAAGEDQPRWSPDGARVSFTTFRDSAAYIHLIPAAGGAIRTVVEHDGSSGDAAWSPDGRCLVFNGGRAEDETRFDLKVWCDDGTPAGTLRRLTDTATVDERDPDWSPDGAHIVFAAKSNDPNATDRWTGWTVRSDGSDPRQIITLAERNVRFPRYDPPGERIAFIAARSNLPFGTLSVFDPDTRAITPLCDLASDTWSWSPDGTEILFANIANSGVRLTDGPLLALSRSVFSDAVRPRAQRAAQYKGLYRIDVASRTLSRLIGPAGGADAPNVPTNFEFGFLPDWTGGTATPDGAPTASATPVEATPTPEPSPTASPTATSTALPSPSAQPTRTATADLRGRRVYLPRLFRAVNPRRRLAAGDGLPVVFERKCYSSVCLQR